MTSQTEGYSFNSWAIQDYLSFGYLYLLLLGVVSDSIYYGMAGINIISYSSVLDVLLSPIIRLTDNLVFTGIIVILPFLMHWWMKFIAKIEKKKQQKQGDDYKKPKGISISLDSKALTIMFTALVIFSAFIGHGLGGGMKIKGKLESGKIDVNQRITFQDGDVSEVKVIGNNSEYIFYIQSGSHVTTVSPIKENIKSIEQILESESDD